MKPRCHASGGTKHNFWASPHRTPADTEDEIVDLRKELSDQGLDTGAHTIAFHRAQRHQVVPSVATTWRILTRKGFVTPQPQKRPRSSFVRFEADQPNERWQADITHWALADGEGVEILNMIDDHSRLLVASDVRRVFKAADIVASFRTAAATYGLTASMLTTHWRRVRAQFHYYVVDRGIGHVYINGPGPPG